MILKVLILCAVHIRVTLSVFPACELYIYGSTISNYVTDEIPSLEASMLSAVTDPHEISLTHCNLENIQDDTFYSASELQHLNLSSNSIENLDPNLFQNLKKLKTLDLSHNKLREFRNESIFGSLKNLENLELHDNTITFLSRSVLESLESLKSISVYGNPVVCDCILRDLIVWLGSRHVLSNGTCLAPPSSKTVSWVDFSSSGNCVNLVTESKLGDSNSGDGQNSDVNYKRLQNWPLVLLIFILVAFITVFFIVYYWFKVRDSSPSEDIRSSRNSITTQRDSKMSFAIYESIPTHYQTPSYLCLEPELPPRVDQNSVEVQHGKNIETREALHQDSGYVEPRKILGEKKNE